MDRGWFGVVGVALAGCAEQALDHSGPADERGRPTVYVDAGAKPGGNGTTWKKAFQTIEEGVTEACEIGGDPIVEIAPGVYGALTTDTTRDEIGIVVRCPMTIRGQTVLDDEDGKATGYDEDDPNLTVVRVSLPIPPAGQSQSRMFDVISSDVTIEGLVLEGGYAGALFTVLIHVGGYAQPVGGRPNCPTGPLDGVTIRNVALRGAGQGLHSYNSNTTVAGVYATDNLIGFTILGGYATSGIHSTVLGSTLTENAWYGGCLFPTSAPFVPACPPSATDTSPTGNDVLLAGNDLTANGFPLPGTNIQNIGGTGLRILALGAGQPDAPGRIDVLSVGNSYTGNRAYGIASDMPVMQSPIRLTHTMEHDVVSLLDEVDDNGRNDVFIGWRIVNQALAVPHVPGTVYAQNSTATFTSWPDEYTYDHEYIESVGGVPLGNVATANGVPLTEFVITPGL